MAVQCDSKILVAGPAGHGTLGNDLAIARYNADGSLDSGFNSSGKPMFDFYNHDNAVNSPVVQPDGKILVAGYDYNSTTSDSAVMRFSVDGTLDTTFTPTSWLTTDFVAHNDVARSVVLSGSKIIVAGYAYTTNNRSTGQDFALGRYRKTRTRAGP
jgi:uncharacterized delta-60 repeat protein